MSTLFGYARTGTARHFAQPRRAWYSGMTEKSLCGVKVNVMDAHVGTAAGATQPAGTCLRCAAALGQTVGDVVYEYDVEGYYAHGWERVCTEESKAEAKARLSEYNDAEPGVAHRIRRVKADA